VDVTGWDIGGVNTKVARVRGAHIIGARSRPFELRRAPHELPMVLRTLASDVGTPLDGAHAVTMTAELSQMFRTKREGVTHIIDAMAETFPNSSMFVYAVDGRFYEPEAARQIPLLVAAANWSATATAVAHDIPDAILIDTGTTTTDIIPLAGGRPASVGRTDPERLASGELVYTGAVRTPVEAIVSQVPLGSGVASVSAEGFALAADVHIWRGALSPDDYSVDPPDGRPTTREHAGVRLARVVCADRDMLDDEALWAIANAVADAQVRRISDAIRRVMARHPGIGTAVVTGVGDFLAAAAAREAGLSVTSLSDRFGADAARCAPAAAVALLLERMLGRSTVSA